MDATAGRGAFAAALPLPPPNNEGVARRGGGAKGECDAITVAAAAVTVAAAFTSVVVAEAGEDEVGPAASLGPAIYWKTDSDT